jgi:hypothetical protein
MLRKRVRTHGRSGTREYRTWCAIVWRCENPKASSFSRYGGRGIAVCPQWRHDFEQFLLDMGPCPPGYSIDRVNNNGNYEPKNCVWASRKTQGRNTNKVAPIEIGGERFSLRTFAEGIGIGRDVLRWAIRKQQDDAVSVARRLILRQLNVH